MTKLCSVDTRRVLYQKDRARTLALPAGMYKRRAPTPRLARNCPRAPLCSSGPVVCNWLFVAFT